MMTLTNDVDDCDAAVAVGANVDFSVVVIHLDGRA